MFYGLFTVSRIFWTQIDYYKDYDLQHYGLQLQNKNAYFG